MARKALQIEDPDRVTRLLFRATGISESDLRALNRSRQFQRAVSKFCESSRTIFLGQTLLDILHGGSESQKDPPNQHLYGFLRDRVGQTLEKTWEYLTLLSLGESAFYSIQIRFH